MPRPRTAPTLEDCIANIFEPGAFPTDSGSIAKPHYSGYLLLEESAPPFALSGLNETTDWIWVPPEAATTSAWLSFTITGTWVGQIAIELGVDVGSGPELRGALPDAISGNGTYTAYGVFSAYVRLRMFAYTSGTAFVTPSGDWASHFLIESPAGVIGKLKLD